MVLVEVGAGGDGPADLAGHRPFLHPLPRERVGEQRARTIERYTTHFSGTSFGTKFEGRKVSMDLPQKLPGLYHAGAVGIIMSGWLGAINYGVIVSNEVDQIDRGPTTH